MKTALYEIIKFRFKILHLKILIKYTVYFTIFERSRNIISIFKRTFVETRVILLFCK